MNTEALSPLNNRNRRIEEEKLTIHRSIHSMSSSSLYCFVRNKYEYCIIVNYYCTAHLNCKWGWRRQKASSTTFTRTNKRITCIWFMSCAILAQPESIASFSFDNTFLAFSPTFCKSFVCSLLDSVIRWVSPHQRCCLQYSATVCTAPPMATPHWEQQHFNNCCYCFLHFS